jgi:hypothetical protein
MGRRTSIDDVFINCPFDDGYAATFEALIFAIRTCGFRPRTAKEIDDCGEARIEKIVSIVRECRFGIHDISRTELDKVNKLPRFNMPLELGLFLGAKRFGNLAQKAKRVLIFDTEKYRYQKFISDLAGMDIHSHGGDPREAIRETRDWLANVSDRQLLSGQKINQMYDTFRSKLPAIAKKLGLDPKKISYADYERIVMSWLAPK